MAVANAHDLRAGGSGCPDAEQLAAYVDGTLDAAARAEVEAHAADCAACRDALAEAMQFLAEDRARTTSQPKPGGGRVLPMRTAWRAGIVTVLAAAAALVVVVRVAPQWLPWGGSSSGSPELQELMAAVAKEPTRPVEGRLAGFPYGPPPPVTRGGSSADVSPEVEIAAAKIRKRATDRPTAQELEALGAAYLATRDYDKAVDALEDGARLQPSNGRVLSDLSAAYLARAQWLDRSNDWPRALAAAERAISADPQLVEPYFNRALALDALHLDADAERAWDEYRAKERDERWAREAATHVKRRARIDLPGLRGQFEAAVAASDRSSAERIVALVPDDAKAQMRDRWFPDWARAWQDQSPSATATLARVAFAGEAIGSATDDWLDRDAARAVAAAGKDGKDRLARAHVEFAKEMALYRSYSFTRAKGTFRELETSFRSAGSPYAELCAMYLGVVEYQANDFPAAIRDAERVRARNERGYPRLAGQAVMLDGLISVNRGDYTDTLERYDAAQSYFERVHSIDDVANVHTSRAEALHFLGEYERAWREQMLAMSLLRSVQSPTRREAVYYTGGVASDAEGLSEVALYFKTHFVEAAEESGARAAVVEALTHVAETYVQLGRMDQALTIVAHARALARELDPAPQAFNVSQLDLVEGRATLPRDPRAAAGAITRAINYYEASGRQIRLPVALHWRARAYAASNQPALARHDFQNGLDLFVTNRDKLSGAAAKADYVEQAWQLLDDYVDEAVRDDNAESLLPDVDRVRANIASANGGTTPAESEGIPAGAAVVSYYAARDALIVWALNGRSQQCVVVHVRLDELSRLAEQFRRCVVTGGCDSDGPGETLYNLVLAPISSILTGAQTLVVIPDGPLALIPFAALPTNQRGRLLIDDFALAYEPSLATVGRAGAPPRGSLSAVLVAAPDAVDVGGTPLPQLSGVDDEVRALATVYATPTTLRGSDLNRATFLASLGRHDVLHFAGHAVVNATDPDLSRLLLSRDSNDAVLASALVKSKSRVRLVVLGACDTSAGRQRHAVGLVTFVQPFLTLGAEGVVASQWALPDAAAPSLFVAFHAGVAAGLTPAVALQRAQIQMRHLPNPALSSPSAWAGVQVFGGLNRLVDHTSIASREDIQ